MASIAVIGPGAIGATVAAWLAQYERHQVVICARTSVDGLQVETPGGLITAQPRIFTHPGQTTPVDWILVATKAYDSQAAARWFDGLMHEHSRVAVLQNGIEHRQRFEGLLDDDRIVPAIVDIPAERTAPGRVVQQRFGTIRVPAGADGEAFAKLFSDAPIDVSPVTDFEAIAWRKLALNCAGAVNALAMRPAMIAHDEGIANSIRGLVSECVAVARAEGVNLPAELADEVLANYRAAPPHSVNSIYADRMAGRPMEYDARNGVIVRRGRKHEIPTPLNQMVTALLNAASPLGHD